MRSRGQLFAKKQNSQSMLQTTGNESQQLKKMKVSKIIKPNKNALKTVYIHKEGCYNSEGQQSQRPPKNKLVVGRNTQEINAMLDFNKKLQVTASYDNLTKLIKKTPDQV